MKKTVLALVVLATAIAIVPVAGAKVDAGARSAQTGTAEIQILGLNDFHGQLEFVPSTSSGGRIGATAAGGVEWLATHVRNLRAENPNTLFVSAGDLIGATPLVSALFHDEPTIEAFNLMGLDYAGVGNHEFDEGIDELLRMQYGNRPHDGDFDSGGGVVGPRGLNPGNGCHPVDGCGDGTPFEGASFDFLAANVRYKSNGNTILPPYKIQRFNGVKVAIVGMTLEGTPTIVTPTAVGNVDFFDEADTVNALVPRLKRQGVETIIVLLHEGGNPGLPLNETTINQCGNLSGALPPIVQRMDDEIDVVVTGHTNWAVNCVVDGKIVTGAAATGRLITDIDLTVSRATNDVVSATVNNRIITRNVAPAPDLTALVDKYRALSAPLANRVVGATSAAITRTGNAAGESALGDVIADSQLAATTPAGLGAAQVAFMNPGGIRADLQFAPSGAEAPGAVTYEEAFTVQPFGNSLVTMTLTGAQIERTLEQQFCGTNAAAPRVLQPSAGFAYTWNAAATGAADCAAADAIDPATITLGGALVDPATSYRVTVNSFLATGGDGFSVLNEGTDRLGGAVDLDALEDYLTATPGGVAPGPRDRITRIG